MSKTVVVYSSSPIITRIRLGTPLMWMKTLPEGVWSSVPPPPLASKLSMKKDI